MKHFLKEKINGTKIDEIKWERTTDKLGYDSYKYNLYFEAKLVDVVIFSNVSHQKASELMGTYIRKKYMSNKV